MGRTYEGIVKDICHKCDEDVAGAISRNMQLVDGAHEMAQVAFMGAASALGAAGGAFLALQEATGGTSTSDEVADGLWLLLKPMVVRSVTRKRATA